MLKTKKVRFEREWNFFRENGRARKIEYTRSFSGKIAKKVSMKMLIRGGQFIF